MKIDLFHRYNLATFVHFLNCVFCVYLREWMPWEMGHVVFFEQTPCMIGLLYTETAFRWYQVSKLIGFTGFSICFHCPVVPGLSLFVPAHWFIHVINFKISSTLAYLSTIILYYHSDVTWVIAPQITGNWHVFQQLVHANNKESIKAFFTRWIMREVV